jgi:hypothetical protein
MEGMASMIARRLGLATLVGVCALAGALSLSAVPALAARGHVYSATFGEKGAGNGQFEEARGVAVNEATGDVYVVDYANNRVEFFAPNATTKAYEYAGQFNGSGELLNEGKAAGSGGLPDEEPTGRFSGPKSIAIDNDPLSPSYGDVYVVAGYSEKVIDKFTASGEYVGQITVKTIKNPKMINFEYFVSVAVDTRGQVLVGEEHEEEGAGDLGGPSEVNGVDNFNNVEANEWESFRRNRLTGHRVEFGLAADSVGDFFAWTDSGSEEAEGVILEFGSSGNVINEAVGGESATGVAYYGVAVEPSTGDVYVDNLNSVGRFGPFSNGGNPEIERFGSGHLPKGRCEALGKTEYTCAGGIAVDSATGQVFAATASDTVQQYILEPPSTPRVEGESFADVSDDSATFDAEINPRSLTGEAGTIYHFEYGKCVSPSSCATSPYEVSTSSSVLAASFEVESVSAHVQGLAAGATYHFRVVAENAHGADEQDTEKVFTTRATGEFALPDARQWQLVSPPDKHGALIEPIGEAWVIQAAAGGGAITYATDAPTESEPAGYDNFQQVLSTRGAAGWSSRNIALPHLDGTGVSIGEGNESRFFSEDLSQNVVQPFGPFISCRSTSGAEQPCLSVQASEQTAFLHTNYAGGSGEPCSSACYAPLVTGEEGYADVPPGTEFGGDSCPPDLFCGPRFVDATPDLRHILLQSGARLTESAPSGGLYEWSAEAPAGKQLQFVAKEELAGSKGFKNSRYAISNDGSRVVTESGGHLYLNDLVKHETVQLDEGLSGSSTYQAASSELSKVFFTSEGKDLYEYDVERHELLRLTENAGVLGLLPGASEDGSWVYFVANGVLGDGGERGAVPGKCIEGVGRAIDTCNLYVLHDGVTSLVAVLSGADSPDWGSALSVLTARVSPNGEWLAFMSQRSLTGYDNLDAASGKPDEEVYEYDAATGTLACASCDPTGARPHGFEYGLNGNAATPNLPLVGGDGDWSGTSWLAANIPGWTPYELGTALYQSRYLSNSGRLFFNSSDGLVPKDVNGQEDVYEFEPQDVPVGEHACSSASDSGGEVFKAERGFEVGGVKGTEGAGCVALISSGSSAQESAFLDASESGGDVFFMTTAKLAPQDFDNALDVYDAHECTSQSPCLPEPAEQPPACTTEASCRPAPSPQPALFGLSGSATFSGAGNVPPPTPAVSKPKTAAQLRAEKLASALKTCRRDKSKRKRAVCEKQAKKRYGVSKAAKRTGDKRRAK